MRPHFASTFLLMLLLSTIILSACGGEITTVRETLSPDKEHKIRIWMNQIPLHADWYGIMLERVDPHWWQRSTANVCTLEGIGEISADWTAPKHLLVTCKDCKEKDLYIFRRKWDDVSVEYRFTTSSPRSGN